ncbi:hypothetical protein [Desulfovibrio gilichinskyi]|uniref:Uncharacterized protein n=1 Tax=Desulfovibrio gilichinskyi TaxID=1519643 RepID=A0A1X7C3Q5_9BACT|nr:hypothetical protein [Desulfovibrio gilichinskyi]SME89474.1 hypothetical protein SAMN06295933_0307 [Desulfovibrio gilichinskyi]
MAGFFDQGVGVGMDRAARGFMDAFNSQKNRSLREKEMDENRAFREQQTAFQHDQINRQNGIQDLTRQANGLAFGGQLQGDMGAFGRTPQEVESKYGFNPLNYVSPGALNYQTPQQTFNKQAALVELNARYKALGKEPKYDVIEDAQGVQKYITKGSQIPNGWRVSKPASVNINNGGAIVGPGGVNLSATEVRDNRKALNAAEGVSKSLDRLESLVDKYGWEPSTGFNTDTVATLDSAHRSVQMEMKELLNLGVLNGPDLDLMDQMLISPTDVPTNPLKWADRKKAIKSSYAEVRKFLERKKKQHLANLGVTDSQATPATSSKADPLGIR